MLEKYNSVNRQRVLFMSTQKISNQDYSVAASSGRSRIAIAKIASWLAIALFASGPVSFLIIDDFGGVVWAVSMLAGFAVTVTTHRRWWPEFRKNKTLILCLAMLMMYLAIPLLNCFLVDGSDFAISRVKRQLLLIGIPFVFLLLWWLRLHLKTVLMIIALNASAFGIYALGFMFSHSERVYGATHAIHFGNVGLFLAFASLALFPISRHRGPRILAVAGMILGVCASVLSGSRGGWLAVPILIFITLIMANRSLRLNRSLILKIAGLTVLVAVGLWQTNYIQKRIVAVQTDWANLGKFDPANAIEVRFLMWEQAWLEIRQAPLLGTGYSGYRNRVLGAVESGYLPKHMLSYSTEPHNEYLYQWATRGAIGLIYFFVCLTWMGWYFVKLLLLGDQDHVAIAQVGLSLITVVTVAGLTISVVDQRDVIRFFGWILAVLMYCVWLCGNRDHSEKIR